MAEKHTITHAIIIAFRNGDDEAFEKIYNHYYNQIYFFALNHVNNTELAKDIVQNTFISAYRSIGKLQHVEAFHVWIMRIAFCECKNVFRKNKVKSVELPENKDIETFVDTVSATMSEHIEDVVLYEIVYDGIQAMSTKLKDVAILRYLDGLSEEEISKVLKIPKGTVKSRIHKTKHVLQEVLKKNDITPVTYKTNYSFAIPTILLSTLTYMSTQQQVVVPDSQNVIQAASLMRAGGLGGMALLASKKGIVATVSATVLAGVGIALNLPQPDRIGFTSKAQIVPPEFREPCEITGIYYNQEYTNQSILLEVALTNDDYDQLLLNDSESMYVQKNGTYTVKIMREGTVLQEQTIQITNIDTESPEYLSYTKEGSTYTLHLRDGVSGINTNAIKYYKNGVASTGFQYNAANQTIILEYEEYTSNVFEVYDNAGNATKVNVVSESLR